jgi:hypothetical protein
MKRPPYTVTTTTIPKPPARGWETTGPLGYQGGSLCWCLVANTWATRFPGGGGHPPGGGGVVEDHRARRAFRGRQPHSSGGVEDEGRQGPEGRTGPIRTGPDRSGPVRTGPDRSGPVRSGPVRTGPDRSGPVRTGPDRTGPDRSGPVRTGPDQSGPDRSGAVPAGPESGPDRSGPVTVRSGPCPVPVRSGTGPRSGPGPGRSGPVRIRIRTRSGPVRSGPGPVRRPVRTGPVVGGFPIPTDKKGVPRGWAKMSSPKVWKRHQIPSRYSHSPSTAVRIHHKRGSPCVADSYVTVFRLGLEHGFRLSIGSDFGWPGWLGRLGWPGRPGRPAGLAGQAAACCQV